MRVLISGAGIAGLTLAWWLERFNFEPTVIEHRPDLSDEGYMIDFYGSGFDVAEKMGLREALAARHYQVAHLVLVNDKGQPRGVFPIDEFRKLLNYRHYDFMRGDLATVLYESLRERVPVKFGVGLSAVQPHADGVEAVLTDGTHVTTDLLIGADGIHSKTRELLWGPREQFEHDLGYDLACGILHNNPIGRDSFYGYLAPNHQASVYPIRGDRLATFFAWKAPGPGRPSMDNLRAEFGAMGWRVPELLEGMAQDPHPYLDTVAQVEMDEWHQGRVALVGDACQCLTLLAGQGASMAMAGAYFLAQDLGDAAGDYEGAFTHYEARLKPEIEKRQAQARGLAKTFIPKNKFDIWVTSLFLRFAFWPGLRQLFRRQIGAGSLIH